MCSDEDGAGAWGCDRKKDSRSVSQSIKATTPSRLVQAVSFLMHTWDSEFREGGA